MERLGQKPDGEHEELVFLYDQMFNIFPALNPSKLFKEMKTKREITQLSYDITGLAIKVHRELGPGLLESVYEKCLRYGVDQE